MKNSRIKLGLVTIMMSAGLLVSCGGPNITPDEKPHEHTLTAIQANDPTYYKEGNIKYYYCPTCDKKYSDAEGTKEITDADVILKKKTVLEETTTAQEEDVEVVLRTADVINGDKKFVTLKKGEEDVTGLYVSHNSKEDYTTITFNFSGTVSDITAIEFDYRYLDSCGDREYDLLGHSFLTKKLDGQEEQYTFVPHTNDKLNKDVAWHTFSFHESNFLEGNIDSLSIKIYHFTGELVINNVYIYHRVAGSTAQDPCTVDHYEDLEGGCYDYDYDTDTYIPKSHEDVEIKLESERVEPTCEQPGCEKYYFCNYTREYYEDNKGTIVIDDLNAWKSEGGRGYLAPAHTIVSVSGQDATCTAAGFKACYKCSECGKYFEDDEAKKLIGTEADYEVWKTTSGKGKIEALGHNFNENGDCTRCGLTVKNYLGLQDATPADLRSQISLSNIGISASDYTEIPDQSTGQHKWGTYDMYGNNGIDLTYDFKFQKGSGSYHNIYLGNAGNEDGLQIRFMTDSDDTKHVSGYFYSTSGSLIKGDGTPFFNGTDSTSHFYVKTASTGAERKLQIKLDPVESPKVDNYNMYKISIFADGFKFHKQAEVLDPIEDLYVGYPKGYFRSEDGGILHNKVRMSYEDNNSGSKAYIKESTVSNPKELIMLKPDGSFFGKSTVSSPITLPELHKDGYKFVGWFDETSERMSNTVSALSKKTIIKPFFTQEHDNMYIPSQFGFDTVGKEYHPPIGHHPETGEPIVGENVGRNTNLPSEAERIDVYFIARPKFYEGKDKFFYFGLPYDVIDANTRVSIRVSLMTNAWYWDSSSTSIGGAGQPGTQFNPSNEGLSWTSGKNYLFHCYIEAVNIAEKTFRFGFDVTNLVDRSSYASSKEFTFNNFDSFKIGDGNRNSLCFKTPTDFEGVADYSITDAW